MSFLPSLFDIHFGNEKNKQMLVDLRHGGKPWTENHLVALPDVWRETAVLSNTGGL